LDIGDYAVQVRAVYKEGEPSLKTAAVGNKSAASVSSLWSVVEEKSSRKDPSKINDLGSGTALYGCLLGAQSNTPNEVVDGNTLLADITYVKCVEQGLVDSDIQLLSLFGGLTVLDVRKNYGLTNISPLGEISQLTWLNLNWNHSIDLAPLADEDKFNSLESLYINKIGLTQIPQFPESVTFISLVGNLISDNAGGYIPDYPMTVFDISNNKAYLDTTQTPPIPAGSLVVNDQLIINLVNSGFSTQKLGSTQSLENFSGFCSLNIESETLVTLTTKRPVQRLDLSESPLLKNAHVFRKGIVHDGVLHAYQPIEINLAGDVGLNCKSYHDVLENTEPRVFDFSVVPSFDLPNGDVAVLPNCPTLTINPEYTLPDFCMFQNQYLFRAAVT